MKIEEQGMICDTRTRPASERIGAFTGLCLASSGSIFCTFHLGAAKLAVGATVVVFRSRDQGRTWRELPARIESTIAGIPGTFSAGEIVEVEPGRLLMIASWFYRLKPEEPIFDPQTEALLPTRTLAAYSTDDGESWTPWRELGMGNLKACTSTGPILKWSDGAIGYPFEGYRESPHHTFGTHGAWMLVSRDGGRSFSEPKLIADDLRQELYFWDQRLCVGRQPGEFIALFWTHDRKNKTDRPIHFLKDTIGEGKTRARQPVSTGMAGGYAAPLLLEDGRILAFLVDREKPGTLSLWSSQDDGLTWAKGLDVYTHGGRPTLGQGGQEIDYVKYWEEMGQFAFGHPAIRSLGNGKVLVAYYAGTPSCLAIHWARVDVTA